MLKIASLLCLLLVTTPLYAIEYWNQNSTHFIRIPPEQTNKLSWSNTLPTKRDKALILNGTYFNPHDRKPLAFIKRWHDLHYDQPIHIPPRPLLFLPLSGNPSITYNRGNIGRWNVGGGPLLVKDSKVNITHSEESFRNDVIHSKSFTSIGVTECGNLIIIVTFNRSMNDIAWCFQFLNCITAMRLDGGSSTYLYIKNKVEVGNRGRCSNYFYIKN